MHSSKEREERNGLAYEYPANAVVTHQRFEGKTPTTEQTTKNETFAIHRFVTEPAKVTIDRSLTINLGNYESARLGVSVTVPCYVEDVDNAYERARIWVEKRVQQEVDSIRSDKPSIF